LGQLEAVHRDFQSKYWANLKLLGQPCNFYARRNQHLITVINTTATVRITRHLRGVEAQLPLKHPAAAVLELLLRLVLGRLAQVRAVRGTSEPSRAAGPSLNGAHLRVLVDELALRPVAVRVLDPVHVVERAALAAAEVGHVPADQLRLEARGLRGPAGPVSTAQSRLEQLKPSFF
jgi:hypothetical protein